MVIEVSCVNPNRLLYQASALEIESCRLGLQTTSAGFKSLEFAVLKEISRHTTSAP